MFRSHTITILFKFQLVGGVQACKIAILLTIVLTVIYFQVTGDTLYNLLRLGEAETDKNDRPLDPPKILSVEVGSDLD